LEARQAGRSRRRPTGSTCSGSRTDGLLGHTAISEAALPTSPGGERRWPPINQMVSIIGSPSKSRSVDRTSLNARHSSVNSASCRLCLARSDWWRLLDAVRRNGLIAWPGSWGSSCLQGGLQLLILDRTPLLISSYLAIDGGALSRARYNPVARPNVGQTEMQVPC
jgi:hypothetical protein